MRTQKTILCLFALITILYSSCKEKNDDFPPVAWSTYYHDKNHQPVTAMLILNDHNEWFGLQGNGGVIYGNGSNHQQFQTNNTAVPFDSVTCLLMDGKGILWVGHKNGLAKFENQQWEEVDFFKNRKVTSLALKGIGEIWAGMHGNSQKGGIAVWADNVWTSVPTAPSYLINCLLVDKNQQVWAGTEDAGLIRMDAHSWTLVTDAIPELKPAAITSLCTLPDGRIIAATAASQLAVLGESEPLILTTGTSAPITTVLSDPSGRLWMATRGAGILTLEGSVWESQTVMNAKIPSDTVLNLTLHPGQQVIAGFPDGRLLTFPY